MKIFRHGRTSSPFITGTTTNSTPNPLTTDEAHKNLFLGIINIKNAEMFGP